MAQLLEGAGARFMFTDGDALPLRAMPFHVQAKPPPVIIRCLYSFVLGCHYMFKQKHLQSSSDVPVPLFLVNNRRHSLSCSQSSTCATISCVHSCQHASQVLFPQPPIRVALSLELSCEQTSLFLSSHTSTSITASCVPCRSSSSSGSAKLPPTATSSHTSSSYGGGS
eukprot:scaffold189681_cov20-Tisochrysis_lutea.AAC.1